MSNRVTFIPCKFVNVRTGHESYGYRAFDDHVSTYGNCWESIPDNDVDFLYKMALEAFNNSDIDDMFQYLSEYERGCYVDNVWYTYEEIRVFLNKWSKYHDGWAD